MKIQKQQQFADSISHQEAGDVHVTTFFMSILLVSIVAFVSGYFWGVKSSVEHLSMQVDQEAFADQISASLIPMPDTQSDDQANTVIQSEGDQSTELLSSSDEQEYVSEQAYMRTYYAQLAGFGSKRSAEKFAQKLEKQDVPVIINAVHSKNRRGKAITWYQVVTESYSTKEELEALVERLKESEKLKDPQIIHC